MTSKEFKQKIQYWSVFDSCVDLFKDTDYIRVFRVVICYPDLSRYEYFSYASDISVPLNCRSCYCDEFTRIDFNIHVSYFKSFVNKCTVYQKMQLSHESSLFNLLRYIGYNVG